MSMLPILGPIFDGGFNLASTVYGNQVMWDRAQQGAGLIDRLNEDIDNEYGNWVNSDLFGGKLDASKFDPANFQSTTDFGALLGGMNSDLNSAEGSAQGYLAAQLRDPNEAARIAGSFVSDVGTDAYLRDAINTATGESKARLGQASQDTIARVLGSGRSLAESRDALAALNYGEGINRSNAIDAAQANAEKQRNDNMQFRANLMGTAFGNQSNTNANLAGSQAGIASTLGQARAQSRYNVGQFQDASQDRDQAQGFDAYQGMLDRYAQGNTEAYNRATDFLGMKQQNILSQAGMISGVDFTIPQTTIGRDINQNQLQRQQMAANEPKGSWMFGIVGGGCIGATSKVTTRTRGEIEIAAVEPGDEVMGADGEFYPVVGKDCGTVPSESRHDLVSLAAGPCFIEATPDHVIGGKPAGQWRPGERILVDSMPSRIERVELHRWTPTADLMLAGNRPYLANGFVVHSNIGRDGIGAWYKHVASLDAEHAGEDNGFVSSIENPAGVWAIAE